MGRVAVSRSFVSIIFICMVTATSSVPMCPMSAPTGAWLPGAVYKAVSAGKPQVSLPLKADGFNRTLSINGFCTPSGMTDLVSSAFSGSLMGGEFQAGFKAAEANVTTTTMTFSGVTCTLKTIAMYKTPQASFEAELRFQFEDCQAAVAPGVVFVVPSSMALVSGLRRDAMAASNVLTWTKEVLEVEGTTPPPPPSKIGVMSNTVLQSVGNGTCKAEVSKELKVPTQDVCKNMCLGETMSSLATNGAQAACSGFAFSAVEAKKNENSCILYSANSSVLESNYKDTPKHFVCFNMSMGPAEIEKSTALVTTTQAPTSSALDFTQREIFAAQPLASATQIGAPVDQPGCFSPVWWFRLTDQIGNPMSVPMSDADLNELLEILPEAKELNGTLSAPTVLDRVVVDACNFNNHWGRPTCFVPAPKTSATCHSDTIGNAAVTGVVTAMGTWLLVGTVFFLIHGSSRRSKDKYEQLVEDRKPQSPCPPVTMLITSVVAVGAACLCSFGSFQLVNEVLRSQSCYDSHETYVVVLPALISTAIAVVLNLQYTARMHPMHSHPMLTQQAKQVDKPQTSLVLVEVPDGDNKVGHPVPMQAGNTMSGSPMSTLQLGSGR